MQDFPETRNSLLLRVRDTNDREAWNEFATIYRPVIYRIARKRGFQEADADDVAQKVLVKLSKEIGSFEPDRERARFRTWLNTICRNTIVDEFRRANRGVNGGPTTQLEQIEQLIGREEFVEELENEHRRELFRHVARQVAQEVEPNTWQAFWMTAVEGRPPQEVAGSLQMRVGTVYTARSRVMQRLRDKACEYDE